MAKVLLLSVAGSKSPSPLCVHNLASTAGTTERDRSPVAAGAGLLSNLPAAASGPRPARQPPQMPRAPSFAQNGPPGCQQHLDGAAWRRRYAISLHFAGHVVEHGSRLEDDQHVVPYAKRDINDASILSRYT
jgi:hypothetical protein